MVKGVGTCAPQPTNSRSQQNRRASFHQRSTIQLNNTVYQRSDYQSFHVKVWARVHHNRPIPDHNQKQKQKNKNKTKKQKNKKKKLPCWYSRYGRATNARTQQNRRASFHQRSTIQLNNTIYQHIDYQSLPLRYGHGCTTADQSQTTFSKRRSSLLMWLQTKLNLLPGFRMFSWRREERTIKQSELEMRNIVQQNVGSLNNFWWRGQYLVVVSIIFIAWV